MANRMNAQRGGVKSDAGKSVSRFNALKFGLLSKEAVIQTKHISEDVELYGEMRKRFIDEIQPVGMIESMLTDKLISYYWRQRRVIAFEKAAIEDGCENTFFGSMEGNLIPLSVDNIQRYEGHLHRMLMQTLHELQRVQSNRKGEPALHSAAVDVTLDSENGFVS